MASRRLLAAVVMAGLALGPTAAFAQTTVNFWQFFTGDTDVKAWRDTIAAFEAENPDIKINMELVPWSEQQQRFVTALATGGLPDISMLGNNVVAQFQATGSLAPLDEYVAAYDTEHGTKLVDDIWPGDKGYYILGGKLWASPIAVETRALYYRKDLFEAAGLDPDTPPDTWEELRRRGSEDLGGGEGRVLRHRAPDEHHLQHRAELHEHVPRVRRAHDRRRRQVRLQHAGVQGGARRLHPHLHGRAVPTPTRRPWMATRCAAVLRTATMP